MLSFYQAIVQGLQEAGVFSSAVQAGQARLEKSLQQENTAFKRPNATNFDKKQSAPAGDTKAIETSKAVVNVKNANRMAAMPPLAPPGLEHLASDLSTKAAANV